MTKASSSAPGSKSRAHLRRRSATSVMINKLRPPRNLTNEEAANLKAKIKPGAQSDKREPVNESKDTDPAILDKMATQDPIVTDSQQPGPRRNPGRSAKHLRTSKSVFDTSEEEESDYEDLDLPQPQKKKKKKQVKAPEPKTR